MFLALGAASSAIDALKSLTSSKSSSSQSNGANPASLFDSFSSSPGSTGSTAGGGSGGGAQISPETMSALLAAQSQSSAGTTASAPTSRSDALKDLFSQIDANGDGKLTKSEFEDALGAGGTNLRNADDVFGKLDKDGDGSVSLNELMSALKGGKSRHRANGSGENGSNSDPLLQALQGASSTSVTNSDGSKTTSLTYADGSKVTMTSVASGASSSTATSSYNFIEQMIQRQAQAISSSATTASLSLSA